MFDHVIVGAGTAGCILASRLTEDPGVNVLLIEAGPEDADENLHTPLGYLKLARGDYDWRYESAPEEHCDGQRIRLPRGRVLGGSSSVNAMIHLRGDRRDYDDWGVPGWGWDELLPCFIRCEDNERGASPLRGAGGPVSITDQHSPSAAALAFLQAGREAGLELNEDFNGERQDGIGLFQATRRHGRRDSAADAYLRGALDRPNLTVATGSLVERILFDGSAAAGVQVSGPRGATDIEAAEVILSAGTYNSPQLLMLSGVGPAAHLREHGIEPICDIPAVGENLSDHLATELLWTVDPPADKAARRSWKATQMLLAAEQGPHTSNLAEAVAFLRVGAGAQAPDIQFHMAPVFFAEDGAVEPEAHGLWLSPCLLAPKSRGTVRLACADPAVAPVIHNGFLAVREDLELLAEGVRAALGICAQPALAPFCARPVRHPADGSAAAIAEHVLRSAFAFFHPVGTCRMGTDAGAVLDGQLRVRGTERLRVVDASVMPAVPRANTNAAVMAIAERAAELIAGAKAPAAAKSI